MENGCPLNRVLSHLQSHYNGIDGNSDVSSEDMTEFGQLLDQMNKEEFEEAVNHRKKMADLNKQADSMNINSVEESIKVKRSTDLRSEINAISQSS